MSLKIPSDYYTAETNREKLQALEGHSVVFIFEGTEIISKGEDNEQCIDYYKAIPKNKKTKETIYTIDDMYRIINKERYYIHIVLQ